MDNTPASVVILGLARQGAALARFFAERGARVTLSDMRQSDVLQAALTELDDLQIQYVLGAHPMSLLDNCDLLCLSGGVPTDLPLVQAASQRGIPLSNDAQEFLRRSPAPVVGITGSAGKTTTTTLVGTMLAEADFTTWVGGNIGNPLINDLPAIQATDRVVMELSSFQLEIMTGPEAVSPQVACVLNITPNHLDRHKTMAAYIAAKRNIVAYQKEGYIAVLGYDEPNARALATSTAARIRYVSGYAEPNEGSFLRGDVLVLRREGYEIEVGQRADIRLRGFHNVVNVLAAIALADAAGAPVDAMQRAIASFKGVAHRLEEVRRWKGVLWVNDSIATAPERVLADLSAFEEPLILLAGGRDKDLPWEALAQQVVKRVRVLITFGEAAGLIREHVERARQRYSAQSQDMVLEDVIAGETLEGAVQHAARCARSGEVVLLSPGGTSFDAFQDFAARGERFRELTHNL